MDWIQSKLDYLSDHEESTKEISNGLFRVYAHIYHHHFPQIIALGQEPHINTSLKHFILFSNVFDLIEEREVLVFP